MKKTVYLSTLFFVLISLHSLQSEVKLGKSTLVTDIEVDGELAITVSNCYFHNEEELSYRIINKNNQRTTHINLEQLGLTKEELAKKLKAKQKIKLKGRFKNTNVFNASELTVTEDAPIITPRVLRSKSGIEQAASMDLRDVLIVIGNLRNANSVSTEAHMNGIMFDNAINVDQAFRTSTFNQVGLRKGNGTSMPSSITITLDKDAHGGYYTDNMVDDLKAELRSRGFDLGSYEHIMFILPSAVKLNGGKNWYAYAFVGSNTSVYARVEMDFLVHELGHNIRFGHSGGRGHEYGDDTCTMGFSGRAQNAIANWNAPKKVHKGWLDAFSGSEITLKNSGSFDLHPLSVDPGAKPGTRVIRVLKGGEFGKDNYFFSYRKASEPYNRLANSGLSQRVSVHRVTDFVKYSGLNTKSTLVTTLGAGQTFDDPDISLSFKVDSIANNGEYAKVSIQYNTIPVAKNQNIQTLQDKAISFNLDVTDPDTANDQLQYTIRQHPSRGTLSGSKDSRTYTPNPGFYGQDSFKYNVWDGKWSSEIVEVKISVEKTEVDPPPPINNIPQVADQSFSVERNKTLSLSLQASDSDNDPLTYQIVGSGPQNGTLTNHTDGNKFMNYTPRSNFTGTDSFQFKVNDSKDDSRIAKVTIQVYSVNSPPSAFPANIQTQQNQSVNITLNGSDPDSGDTLSYQIVQSPSQGSLSGSGRSRTYTPRTGFYGNDSFTFRVYDGQAYSSSATVSINVLRGNRAPVIDGAASASPSELAVSASTTLNVEASDPDNDNLRFTWSKVSGPGEVRFNPANKIGKQMTASFLKSGTYQLKVTVSDSKTSVSSTTTVKANDAPGLWYGKVSGFMNTSAPNPKTQLITNVAAKTEDSLVANETEIFTGYFYDADGNISFSEQMYGKATIAINGRIVVNDDGHWTRADSSNLKLSPGWHSIEIRISNNQSGNGPIYSNGIAYDPNGGQNWKTIFDPGDGSFLSTAAGSPPPPIQMYTLTVNQGSGDGTYEKDAVVNIRANTPPVGKEFDRWTGQTSTVQNIFKTNTSLTMPANNITISATYKDIPVTTYSLTVNSGSGDGTYEAGKIVSINADAPPQGMIFEAWTGDISTISDVTSPSTSLSMPAKNSTITATYKSTGGNGQGGELGILDVTANQGINPATNEPWKNGDQYRFVFVSSATSKADSNLLSTYDSFLQNLAQSAGLGRKWKVIGSSATQSARDHTASDPTKNGSQIPIFLLDGTTIVAKNYGDLWDGYLDAPINRDERGNTGIIANVFTGTNPDGSIRPRPLGGSNDSTPLVATGKCDKNNNRWTFAFSESATKSLRLYAISELLTLTLESQDTNQAPIAVSQPNNFVPIGTRLISFYLSAVDPDRDSMTFEIVRQPNKGSVKIRNVFFRGEMFNYSPNEGATGNDSFEFVAIDEHGARSNRATIHVTFGEGNSQPIAMPKYMYLKKGDTAYFQPPGIDAQDDKLTYRIDPNSLPSNGYLSNWFNGNVLFAYSTDQNFEGEVILKYRSVDDKGKFSETSNIHIIYGKLQSLPPIVNETIVETPAGVPTIIYPNAEDPEGDKVTYNVIFEPVKGSIYNFGTAIAYIPNPGFTGKDTIYYSATDGNSSTPIASIDIYVGISTPAAVEITKTNSGTEDKDLEQQETLKALEHAVLNSLDIDSTTNKDTVSTTDTISPSNETSSIINELPQTDTLPAAEATGSGGGGGCLMRRAF